ncbi:MAG: ATP-binding protein [Acidobacteria bacterium]|nr:MAG: ATP-binding protein [Acidobacteriota bacterium]
MSRSNGGEGWPAATTKPGEAVTSASPISSTRHPALWIRSASDAAGAPLASPTGDRRRKRSRAPPRSRTTGVGVLWRCSVAKDCPRGEAMAKKKNPGDRQSAQPAHEGSGGVDEAKALVAADDTREGVAQRVGALRVPGAALRWRCGEDCFQFETTSELDALDDVVAQGTAREALEFGLLTRARGQNVYVRGLRGTGRRTLVRQVIRRMIADEPRRWELRDHCYVHNFAQPDRPRLITLPAGQARVLRDAMKDFASYLTEDFPKLLDAEALVADRRALEAKIQQEVEQITAPLEKELENAGLKLVTLQQGQGAQTVIFPVVNGQPMPPAQLQQLIQKGEVSRAYLERYEEKVPEYQQRVEDVGQKVMLRQREGMREMRDLVVTEARKLLESALNGVQDRFPGHEAVAEFTREVLEDVLENRLRPKPDDLAAELRYGVNIVLENQPDADAPVIEEMAPNMVNLVGTVEIGLEDGDPRSATDYRGVRAGALLRADGGYLILNVTDVLSEQGAWRALIRTLRSGQLEIVPPELTWFRPRALVNPEPIDVRVRVILMGDARNYYLLDQFDPEFGDLFKVLSDFDHEIDRDDDGVRNYASVISHIVTSEDLLPFRRCAVGALVEHGARIASRAGKLTARFGRLADIAREAEFVARRAGAERVDAEHVREAVRRTKQRASLPSRKFQELIRRGTIRIETAGEVVGQVNGLAVIGAGPITYGFPARITATISAGRAGLIDIEASASLSGSIHTKGFHILGGLLRHLLRLDHPLAFSASLAFEQSYGGIDGDSASGAETCCLLSALTGVPIRQSIAMTGAIDQHGHVQAIGGVNEKIEGFYDACRAEGLTGEQGVIVPHSNAGDLMLREDVVDACGRGEFSVWAVRTIHQALEVLTGMPAGRWTGDGYPPGTLLHLARRKAHEYWRLGSLTPRDVDSDGRRIERQKEEEDKAAEPVAES